MTLDESNTLFLKGKHALVTGGGTGIGLAIARALVAQGATVSIGGRRAEILEEVAQSDDRISAVAMDVSQADSVHQGVQSMVEQNGPVQICVANAGIAEGQTILKMDHDFWRKMMAINLDGAFLTVQACLPSMQETDWGRVIAISSIAGIRGLRGAPAYTASKHGMIGLIRALSEDYMGSPYTFNALCPGYVETEIVTRNQDAIAERTGMSAENALQVMVKANRHKRLIAAKEVADAALWLCGPHSGSVNGQAIQIAGGQM